MAQLVEITSRGYKIRDYSRGFYDCSLIAVADFTSAAFYVTYLSQITEALQVFCEFCVFCALIYLSGVFL